MHRESPLLEFAHDLVIEILVPLQEISALAHALHRERHVLDKRRPGCRRRSGATCGGSHGTPPFHRQFGRYAAAAAAFTAVAVAVAVVVVASHDRPRGPSCRWPAASMHRLSAEKHAKGSKARWFSPPAAPAGDGEHLLVEFVLVIPERCGDRRPPEILFICSRRP